MARNILLNILTSYHRTNELVCSEFIAKISEYSAEQLIFIEESAKDERTLSREYGYAFTNEEHRRKSFSFGENAIQFCQLFHCVAASK